MSVEVAIVTIIIVIVLWYVLFTHKSESFDVYNNHAEGASYVYELSGIPATGQRVDMSVPEAGLIAKYTWSEKDPVGLNVYDHMYEDYTNVFKYADERPFTAPNYYSYRDVGSDIGINSVYDSKFQILTDKMGKEGYGGYDIAGMVDTDPLYMNFHGENIVLSQKNF